MGSEPRMGFVGAGTLGNGLAQALEAVGYPVVAVSSRSPSSAQRLASRITGCQALAGPQDVAERCDLVFVTTPDDAIDQVAGQVRWREGQGAVHCSGALSLEVLEPAARMGASTGSLHPFQTFACLEGAEEAVERLQGISFAIEAQGWLLSALEGMISRLGGTSKRLRPKDRALYHSSAILSCGYLVALLRAAMDTWEDMGVSAEEALEVILPLARTTLANVSRAGAQASVTGPMARGDVATVRRHLEALEARVPHLLPLYCSLTRESLPLVRDRISPETHKALELLSWEFMGKYVSSMGP